ncbi:MAG: hypothetical protein QXN52_08925 [Nitrososphaerota archaeon]
MNISDLLNNPHKLEEIFSEALLKRNKELIDLLVFYIKNSKLVFEYARDIVGGKVSDELEEVIIKSAYHSYLYAKDILRKPWKKGESIISQDPEYSYYYARDVIKGPWEKGEDAIAQDLYYSYLYAKDVLHKPFPKGESAIAQDPRLIYYYAKDVVRGKVSDELEEIIASYGYYALKYARDILKSRFIKSERVIIKNREYLNQYVDFLRSINKLDEFYGDYSYIKE